MKTKNSKKILSTTVFAAIIVLLAFAVMSTSVSAKELDKKLNPDNGGLGTEITVTIDKVKVKQGETVTVVDTLPEEFTYILGTFKVDGASVEPTVTKTAPPPPRSQVISHTIYNSGPGKKTYTIEFDAKVTKAYAWKDETVTNTVVGTWYDKYGQFIKTEDDTANFKIYKFEDLYKYAEGPEEPVIGVPNSWTLGMGITNNFDYIMTDTSITDRFGGDLKIDSITAADGTIYTFEYDENYGTKQAEVTITGGIVPVTEKLKDGVTIGDFHISWTGKTQKAHFAWTIGTLASDASTEITIGVSTDKNPAGNQEYTSLGPHTLNSGATLKFIDEDMMQLSAVTDSIKVLVP